MYAQKRRIDNTHIVRERDRERFRELVAVFSLGVPVALFLLLFTWQNLEVIRLARESGRLQKTREILADENKNLQLQLERMTDLDTVETKARKLGLERTQSSNIVLVEGRASSPARRPVRGFEGGRPSNQ